MAKKKTLEQKIDQTARDYIVAHLRFKIWDDCDAMHQIDTEVEKWEVLTDGEPTLKEYIEKNLLDFYREQVVDVCEETGETLEQNLEWYGDSLIIPYE